MNLIPTNNPTPPAPAPSRGLPLRWAIIGLGTLVVAGVTLALGGPLLALASVPVMGTFLHTILD